MASLESLHPGAEVRLFRPDDRVLVRVHQAARHDGPAEIPRDTLEPVEVGPAVAVVSDDPPPGAPLWNDVADGSGTFLARMSGHPPSIQVARKDYKWPFGPCLMAARAGVWLKPDTRDPRPDAKPDTQDGVSGLQPDTWPSDATGSCTTSTSRPSWASWTPGGGASSDGRCVRSSRRAPEAA